MGQELSFHLLIWSIFPSYQSPAWSFCFVKGLVFSLFIGPLFYTSFISGFESHSLMLTTLLKNLSHALGMGKLVQFSSSVMFDSATPWIAARQASLSITNSRSLLKLMSIESVMSSSHLILSCPLLLLPPIPHQGLFQWVNSLHEVAKVLEFQLQYQSFQWTPMTDLL